jgi:O-antigen ligase
VRPPAGHQQAEGDRAPWALLLAALLALSLGLVYPAAAWPFHGAGAGLLIVVAAAGAALAMARGGAVPGTAVIVPGALLVVVGWLAMLPPRVAVLAGSLATGRTTLLLAALAFLLGGALAVLLRGEDQSTPAGAVAPSLLVERWILAAAAALAVFAIYQVVGPASLPRTFAAMEAEILADETLGGALREGMLNAVRERRAAATLGAPNVFATLMALALPMALARLVAAGGAWRARIAHAAILAVVGAALVMSGSRGGLVAALVGGGVVVALRLAAAVRGPLRLVLAGGMAMVLVAVVGVLVWVFSLDAENSRWLGGSGLGQRVLYWQTAIAAWRTHPLLGGGTGAFEVLYPLYRQPGANETRHAHSWFFQMLADGGIVMLVVYTAALTTAGWAVARRCWAGGGDGLAMARVGMAGGLTAMAIHGMADYTFVNRETSLVFHGLLGWMAGWAAGAGRRRWLPPVLVAAAALPCLYTGWTSSRLAMAAAIRQGALSDPTLPPAVVMEELGRAIRMAPEDGAGWEARARLRSARHDGLAMADFNEALAREPLSARLHEAVSQHHERAGDLAAAISWQERAIALHPLDPTHHLRLAVLMHRAGDVAGARARLDHARGLVYPTRADRAVLAAAEAIIDPQAAPPAPDAPETPGATPR